MSLPAFGPRFETAIAAMDAANAADPTMLHVSGVARPKELAHSEMMTHWVSQLAPDASEALHLAARAHHIRRWETPRSSYPEGRQGYLKWRSDLHRVHAGHAADILRAAGYDEATIDRTSVIIQKQDLRRDHDVQVFEDALGLVFLETQFHEFSAQHDAEKLSNILRRTWRKMSPAGQASALDLPLHPADRAFIVSVLSGGDDPEASPP